MACRKAAARDGGRIRKDAAAAVGEALLLTTMCIMGMPVDVHAKDGSVFSGIFHTASVDDRYAIVLKNARKIKKGNLDANVVKETLIETLVVRSEDLVQVVAKGVQFPSNGMTGYFGGNGIEAAAGYSECLDTDVEVAKSNHYKGNKNHKSQSRSGKRENGFLYSSTATSNPLASSSPDHIERLDMMKFEKIEEAQNVSVDVRQVVDSPREIHSDSKNNPEFQDKRVISEGQGSSRSATGCEAQSTAAPNILLDIMHQESKGVSSGYSHAPDDQDEEQITSDGTARVVASSQNVSVASTPTIDAKSESCLNASSTPYLLLPPKSTSVSKTAKDSKLNPGAKMFSPSMSHHRTVSPPAVPNGAGVSYMPGTYTVAPTSPAQDEFDANSFARSSVPVKLVPYNNVTFGHGADDAPNIQPIIGQMLNRMHPVRYNGHYQNFQTGPTYPHPNPQNVMLGRVGPLVCMHPISSDAVQSAAGFSPVTTPPLLTSHHVHLNKHQGNASAQALQLCMTPPIIANGSQPFLMPSSIPISQPLFPVLRPIPVPGSNGLLSSKFA